MTTTADIVPQPAGNELAFFKNIIDSLPLIIFIKDASGKYVFINMQFEKDFNVSKSQAIGKTDNELLGKEIADSLIVNDKRVLESGKQLTFEETISTTEGNISYTVMKFVLKDEAGKPLICGVYRDNSNYKRMQDVLRSSENRFNFVLAATQDSIYDWDLETDRIWRNEQYERIFDGPFGPHPDWWKEHIHEDDFERITTALQKVFDKNEQLWNQEYRFKRIKGDYAFVIDRGFVIYNSGKPTRMIGAITDITERKQFIYDLEHSLALSKATFDATTDGILVVNLEGKIVDFNKKFVKMWGLPDSSVESKDSQSIIDFMLAQLKEPEKYINKVNELNINPEVESFDVLEFKDGKTFERYSNPERANESIIGKVFSFRDITQRIKAEEFEKKRTLKFIERQTELMKLNLITSLPFQEKLNKIIETDAKAIDVERVSIQFFDKSRNTLSSEKIYLLSKASYEEGISIEREDYPRYFQELESNKIIDANNAEEDPRTAELTTGYLKKYGILSVMNVPVIYNGEMVGIICHEHLGSIRKWTYEEEVFTTSIADIVSLALESDKRKKTEEELKKLNEGLEERVKVRTSELKTTEDKYKVLIESAYDSIISINKEGKIILWNKAAEKTFGYKESEAIGQPINIIMPQQYVEKHKKGFESYLKTKEPHLIGKGAVELSGLKKGGIEFPIELSLETWKFNGEDFFTAIIKDITERKSSEKEMQKQNEHAKQGSIFFDSIFDNIPNLIYLKDATDLRYVRVNKALAELLGFKKEDLIGKNDYDFFPKEQADVFISKERDLLTKGEPVEIPEEPIDTKNGKRWLHTFQSVIMDDSGKPLYLLAISTDITQQKMAEDKSKEKSEKPEA